MRVFEIRMQRRIFGLKRDKVTGEWRKLLNEELNDLCCSPETIRLNKSRRMRWTEYVVRMGERRNACRLLMENP